MSGRLEILRICLSFLISGPSAILLSLKLGGFEELEEFKGFEELEEFKGFEELEEFKGFKGFEEFRERGGLIHRQRWKRLDRLSSR